MCEDQSSTLFEEELTELDIPINSNVFVALGDFSSNKLEVYDMYRPMTGMAIRFILNTTAIHKIIFY